MVFSPNLTPFTQFSHCTLLALLDAALSFPLISLPLISLSFTYVDILLVHILLLQPARTILGTFIMPVLDKNADHESNRDLDREKDRDRDGKDREKGSKAKASTKSMLMYPLRMLPVCSCAPRHSEGPLSRSVQVFQGWLLYRRGLVSLFPCEQRTRSAKRCLRLVRQG